jgi:hypothetical protein
LIERAFEQGETVESIARRCSVNSGSVKRWLQTGKANRSRIAPLAALVGPVYASPDAVAQELIAVYHRKDVPRGAPLRIKRSFVKKIAGRSRLKGAFEGDIVECLDSRGYILLETVDDQTDDDVYLLMKRRWLLGRAETSVSRADLEEYFTEKNADHESDDEDAKPL